jgi:large subunit ribosomal protein L4
MPEAPILGATKKVKLDDGAFGVRFNGPLVHQSVRAEQAARRRGTAATKTRAMVSGGGAKPWRQKGTGRARAGSNRSPIWTGGGVVFGPQPRSYTFKVNRKEQRAALRSALSLHADRGSLAILDTVAFKAPKTSQAADLLDDWGQSGSTLLVLAPEERDAALSFRNLKRVAVLTAENVGVADLLSAASLLVSQDALDALTTRAANPSRGESAAAAPAPNAAKPKVRVKETAPEPAAVVEAEAKDDSNDEGDAATAEENS